MQNPKEIELTGRSLLRRQMSALDCSAVWEGGGGGGEEEYKINRINKQLAIRQQPASYRLINW
jgi:hypothetical protein